MIFDAFLYNGETEVFNIRYAELLGKVKFVPCQSSHTFSGKSKNYEYFTDAHNVIPVYFDKKPHRDPWKNESEQREYLLTEGLKHALPNDIVLLGDVDEIPPGKFLKDAITLMDSMDKPIVFNMSFYYYFLNLRRSERWNGTIVCKKKHIKSMEKLRRKRNKLPEYPGGWHFSFLGGPTEIIKKIEAFSHQEYNTEKYKDQERILDYIRRGIDLFDRPVTMTMTAIDDTYPEYVKNNLSRWKEYICAS